MDGSPSRQTIMIDRYRSWSKRADRFFLLQMEYPLTRMTPSLWQGLFEYALLSKEKP